MSMTTAVHLTKENLDLVQTILSRFVDVDRFTLVRDNNTAVLSIVFDTTVHNLPGIFKINLTAENAENLNRE